MCTNRCNAEATGVRWGRSALLVTSIFAATLSLTLSPSSAQLFHTPTEYPAGNFNALDMTEADFDEDGDLDLAVANRNFEEVTVLLNDECGGFVLGAAYGVAVQPDWVMAADIDGDGDTDIAVFAPDGSLRTLRNQGGIQGGAAGTFMLDVRVYLTNEFGPADFGFLTAADLNADGAPDLITAVPEEFEPPVGVQHDGSVTVLLNRSDGSGEFEIAAHLRVEGLRPQSVVVTDLNGDEAPDLAVTNLGPPILNQDVLVYFNDGAGTFVFGGLYESGESTYAVAAGDFDGENGVDLAVTDISEGNTVSMLFNDGDGTLTPGASYATGINPVSVIAADLDTDAGELKDLDLVLVNEGDDNVTVLYNLNRTGAFRFDPDGPYGTGAAPVAAVAADLNGDHDLDLAVLNADDATVSVFRNLTIRGSCDPDEDGEGCCGGGGGCIGVGCFAPPLDCCSGPQAQPCWAFFGSGGVGCGDPGVLDLFAFGLEIQSAIDAKGSASVAQRLQSLQMHAMQIPFDRNVMSPLQQLAAEELEALAGRSHVTRRDLHWTHRLHNAWDLDQRTDGLEVPATVPAGQNVSVSLGGDIMLTFDTVHSLVVIRPRFRQFGPRIPAGFHAPIPLYHVDFERMVGVAPTTGVTITMSYAPVALRPGASVRLLHEEQEAWVDRTVTSNPSAKTVTARVLQLSRFMLAGTGAVTGITCPLDRTLACGADTSPSATGTAAATGTGGPITITYDDVAVPESGCPRVTTRTWIATDGFSGASCIQRLESVGAGIPAVSAWGLMILAGLMLVGGTLVLRNACHSPNPSSPGCGPYPPSVQSPVRSRTSVTKGSNGKCREKGFQQEKRFGIQASLEYDGRLDCQLRVGKGHLGNVGPRAKWERSGEMVERLTHVFRRFVVLCQREWYARSHGRWHQRERQC